MPNDKFDLHFFANSDDKETHTLLAERMQQLEDAGQEVATVPTSGAPAFWADGYEVVGRTAILNLTQLGPQEFNGLFFPASIIEFFEFSTLANSKHYASFNFAISITKSRTCLAYCFA